MTIVIAGDFNYNYSNTTSRRKAASLFDPYGLVQHIDEPTRFAETSDSIRDLLLTRNVSSVILSGVGDAFLDQTIRYEPVHEISNNLVCATSKASDQPAHTRSLIRAFASRLSIL